MVLWMKAPAAAAAAPAPAPESRRGRHDVKQEHLAVQVRALRQDRVGFCLARDKYNSAVCHAMLALGCPESLCATATTASLPLPILRNLSTISYIFICVEAPMPESGAVDSFCQVDKPVVQCNEFKRRIADRRRISSSIWMSLQAISPPYTLLP